MIRSSKIALSSRIAALLAGFLSVAGAFGLHPEPVSVATALAAQAGWTSSAETIDASPHVCLACLAHRSTPLPGLTTVVLAPRPVAVQATRAAPPAVSRLDSHPAEGRAPPSLG